MTQGYLLLLFKDLEKLIQLEWLGTSTMLLLFSLEKLSIVQINV